MSENKDIFDYDSYVKSKDKKKSKAKKPPRSNNSNNSANKQKQKENEKKKREMRERQEKKRDESIESIRRMFDDALDERAEEMAELTRIDEEPELPITVTENGRRRGFLILGAIIIVLAIVGFFSTVSFTIEKFRDFADNTQQKTEFAQFIYPVVICDPAPFDQTVKLRSDTVITAAIWDIILYEDKSKYEADFDIITVPELDVEQHAAKLFGQGLTIKHQSILGSDIQFYYNEDIKSYRIPANPKYFTYSPYIEEITRVGESYTVLVGYVSPTPSWLTLTSDDEPKPEKYVYYTVSKRGDDYTLVGIQQSDKQPEEAGEY